jgi:hypothetical protein
VVAVREGRRELAFGPLTITSRKHERGGGGGGSDFSTSTLLSLSPNKEQDKILYSLLGKRLTVFHFYRRNKNLYRFLNFKAEHLMSCRLCHFPRGEDGNIWEKSYLLEYADKLIGGSPYFLFVYWMNY